MTEGIGPSVPFTDDDYTIRPDYISPDRIHVKRRDGRTVAFAVGEHVTFAEVKRAMAEADANFLGGPA
jgi:hypothetical protein